MKQITRELYSEKPFGETGLASSPGASGSAVRTGKVGTVYSNGKGRTVDAVMPVGCYIYTRVSTAMQVDGYSLEAQRDRLRKYAEYQEMRVVREYSDEGKSGKNVDGRPAFRQMLLDIESGQDPVSFVLVFKLSRFGRNAADVLNSLQKMQDYGVNLICVEDGIDSSKDSGKLMISVLSSVAEIERENILAQTMEGRRQKAREGKWNGGFAPYGYTLINGELKIAEDEVEVIRLIYDRFINTTMGANGVADWLNEHGYCKKIRQNNTLENFTENFVKGVLDNPVYCGKIAYGRRKTEKISGKRNEYHIVQQQNYMLHDGIHEAIVSEKDWQKAKEKRLQTGVKWEKIHNLGHEHLLSGLLKCPVCGASMYANVSRKRKPDGSIYKDYFFYQCKHRVWVDGKRCDYRRQWSQEIIDGAVEEVIYKLVQNPRFESAMKEKINNNIDTGELTAKLETLQQQLRQQNGAKEKLGWQIDKLNVSDRHYEKKYDDMLSRLDALYDQIAETEEQIKETENQIRDIKQQKVSADNVYQFLLCFEQLYDQFSDADKKAFLNSFIERIEIYPERLENGQILKSIVFRFPIFYDNRLITEISWEKENTVETVCLLEHKE